MRTISLKRLPESKWFPDYLGEEDEFAMLAACKKELNAWRATVADHKALPTIEAKLGHRRALERSYDVLKAAWVEVLESEPLLMAA